MALNPDDIKNVKAQGFLLNKGTDCFSGRVLSKACVFSAKDLAAIAECAEKFGNGKIGFTSRLCAEIIGIPFEKIPEAQAYMAEHGLYFGGTGAKIRPITACKGTTCIYGNCDTQGLAAELHERYYLGWGDVTLPHKFKIGVGGCPHSCMKPSLNDFGIEANRVPGQTQEMYQIYVGGTWGKNCRMGTKLSRLVNREEIFPIIEKAIVWFKSNANEKERLGKMIDRLGVEAMEAALFADEPVEKPVD